ncbi:hypothetical protein OEZ86_010119 [Tetradesmus obliquus]|nr:hypothetical protein OEZ86_010119 [Tetradesmus obliquus]
MDSGKWDAKLFCIQEGTLCSLEKCCQMSDEQVLMAQVGGACGVSLAKFHLEHLPLVQSLAAIHAAMCDFHTELQRLGKPLDDSTPLLQSVYEGHGPEWIVYVLPSNSAVGRQERVFAYTPQGGATSPDAVEQRTVFNEAGFLQYTKAVQQAAAAGTATPAPDSKLSPNRQLKLLHWVDAREPQKRRLREPDPFNDDYGNERPAQRMRHQEDAPATPGGRADAAALAPPPPAAAVPPPAAVAPPPAAALAPPAAVPPPAAALAGLSRAQLAAAKAMFFATQRLQPGPQRWRFGGQGTGSDVEVVLHVNAQQRAAYVTFQDQPFFKLGPLGKAV